MVRQMRLKCDGTPALHQHSTNSKLRSIAPDLEGGRVSAKVRKYKHRCMRQGIL